MTTAARGITQLVLVLALIMTSVGCGTIRGVDASWPEPEFFPGVRTDINDVSEGGVGLLSVIDFPVSLVADIVLVPIHTFLYARAHLLTPPHDGTEFQLQKTEDFSID